ncbi:hypothetical protein M8756_15690 [Lutimaribacter sp. EGI FJ00015]|nr:hypothetical protein [Lutimaribacter sp. EGI FJ00015]
MGAPSRVIVRKTYQDRDTGKEKAAPKPEMTAFSGWEANEPAIQTDEKIGTCALMRQIIALSRIPTCLNIP